jgi:hypothetical protein
MVLYSLAVLGEPSDEQRSRLTATLADQVGPFGLELGRDVSLHDALTVPANPPHSAFAAMYFLGGSHNDLPIIRLLHNQGIPIIPIVPQGGSFSALPVELRTSNGLKLQDGDPKLFEIASSALECIGLLRKQRRAFVSYRRTESKSAAAQLHDLLTAKGFDVFLDTHDVRPGDPFQDVLWHRLCDCDVLLMLDTPGYFASSWTRQELVRARSKSIQVLKLVWPDHVPDPRTSFAEAIELKSTDLVGADGPITEIIAARIVLAVESLRSRAIAARYMAVTGSFRAEVQSIGGAIDGIGAHRAMSVRMPDGKVLWAYPVVGIPTADIFNDIANKAANANQTDAPILVYDDVGIRDQWLAHLKWLDQNISSVRAIRARQAAWDLANWA